MSESVVLATRRERRGEMRQKKYKFLATLAHMRSRVTVVCTSSMISVVWNNGLRFACKEIMAGLDEVVCLG